MVHNLSQSPSVIQHFLAELRDVNVQRDPLRFRRNLERIGEIIAYEISKTMSYQNTDVETPLGTANHKLLKTQPVLATILRAGLPLHQGLLNVFDRADNAFISAYRRHHKDGTFEIHLEYVSCPDLTGRTVILADPMLATGASIVIAAQELLKYGKPVQLHIVTAISATDGINHVRRLLPQAIIWTGAIDSELTAKSYIVPGLGDAGDLAFGQKLQE